MWQKTEKCCVESGVMKVKDTWQLDQYLRRDWIVYLGDGEDDATKDIIGSTEKKSQ